jgi:hypothetical protein
VLRGRNDLFMYGLFVQIVILVAITHGLRALGRVAGPRRCGLILGLPSSTALMLLYCGQEYGVGEAMAMAESSLLGLVAAANLPLAYARAIRGAAQPLLAPASAIVEYVVVAAVFRALPSAGAGVRLGLSIAGVLVVCYLARRVRIVGGAPSPSTRPSFEHLALGTMVPGALIVTVRIVRGLGGSSWAGLFTTFPAMSLALLVATHLDAGPEAACRMARAMPPGGLITLGFLAAFRLAGHRIGLVRGTAFGYGIALATLLALEGLIRSLAADSHPGTPKAPRLHEPLIKGPFPAALAQTITASWSGCPEPIHRRRRQSGRRFAPRIEVIPEEC